MRKSKSCYPQLKRGTDYKLLKYIGKGMYGLVVLAQHRPTNKLHVLKIATKLDRSKDREKEIKDHMHDFIREHVMQHHAYILLKNSATTTCRVPRPVGYLKYILEGRPRYAMVGEFVEANEKYEKGAITMQTALEHDFLSIPYWASIFENLIKAVKILQGQDIYHLDINPRNLLLKFSKDLHKAPTPYLIDFGFSTRQKDSRRELRGNVIIPDPGLTKEPDYSHSSYYPNIPPENFTDKRPHKSADLYAISYLIKLLCNYFPQLATVSRFIEDFRSKSPDNRESFDQFLANLMAAFGADVADLSDHRGISPDAADGRDPRQDAIEISDSDDAIVIMDSDDDEPSNKRQRAE